jgi:methyl-accepting chemotaxis protein
MNTVGLARDSISMLEELALTIKRTAELVEEINASSREQNLGI